MYMVHNVIKNLIFIVCMIVLVLPIVNAYVYYEIDVHYEGGVLDVTGSDVIYDRFERTNLYVDGNGEPKFKLDLFDEMGKLVHSEWVNVPISGIEHYGDEEGNIVDSKMLTRESFDYSFIVPYRENVNEIIIYDAELNEVSLIDTSVYAKERSDSGSFLQRGDSDVTSDSLGVWFYLLIVVVLVLILIAIIYYLFAKKKFFRKQ